MNLNEFSDSVSHFIKTLLFHNCRLKRATRQKESTLHPTDNVSTAPESAEPAEYEPVGNDNLDPGQEYAEINEMEQITGGNNTMTGPPDANNNPDEYQELHATPDELATWREQFETGNTGLYQELAKDNGMVGRDSSQQYYNMPSIAKGKEAYSNVPLHSQ